MDASHSSHWPAWITALVAVGALFATVFFQYRTRQDLMKQELLKHRRKALFDALEVIDHVYGNEPLLSHGKRPNPHQWDSQMARNVDNQMRIYCKYPETLSTFRSAIGLHNPTVQKSTGIDLRALDEFRRQVSKELELPEPVGFDENAVWISNLSGAVSSHSADGQN